MANNFQLFPKGSNTAARLFDIDEEICTKVLNVPVDAKNYGGAHSKNSFDWFNTIGYLIASGRKLGSEELRLKVAEWTENDPIGVKVLQYLEDNYTSNSFITIGK